jgi:hypothetical protein
MKNLFKFVVALILTMASQALAWSAEAKSTWRARVFSKTST